MGLMSLIMKGMFYIIIAICLLSGIVIYASLMAVPLLLNPTMPPALKMIGAIVPPTALIVGVILIIKTEYHKLGLISLVVSFSASSIALGLSVLLQMPVLLLIGGGAFVGYLLHTKKVLTLPSLVSGSTTKADPTGFFLSDLNQNTLVGGFTIIQTPLDYIEESTPAQICEPFYRIIRTCTSSDVPIGLILERVNSRTRALYYTLGIDKENLQANMSLLESALKANLYKFGFEEERFYRTPPITSEMIGAVATIEGEPLSIEDPQQHPDPLTIVSDVFLRHENAIIQVLVAPARRGLERTLMRWWKGRQYEEKKRKSETTVQMRSGRGSQETTPVIDVGTSAETSRLRRDMDRYRAEHACEVTVGIASWHPMGQIAERNVRHMAEVFKGAIVPADPEQDLRVRVTTKQEVFRQFTRGLPAGNPTHLALAEATILPVLPRREIGPSTVRREDFSTAIREDMADTTEIIAQAQPAYPGRTASPNGLFVFDWRFQLARRILLGFVLKANGTIDPTNPSGFGLQVLEGSLLITGNQRTGKTSTAICMTAQASRAGVRTLILVPRRARDWEILMCVNPDLKIFTPGNPSGVLFRLNIFRPPKNVALAEWLPTLVAIFTSYLPSDRVMSLHFDDIFHTLYRNCGWNIGENTQGPPILLSDFWNAVEEVCHDFQYADELKRNFYGALYGRFAAMYRNQAIVDMYNTTQGITWEQLMNWDVIMDMEKLPSEDRDLLMSLLAAGAHMYKMANPTRAITNMVILEEAHYIARRTDATSTDGYGQNVRQMANVLIRDMLTTGGGNGLSTAMVEQLPSRLLEDAVKLARNVVVHTMSDESERNLIKGHLGLTDAQAEHIQQMDLGETVVYLQGDKRAKNVQIFPLGWHVDAPLEKVTVRMDNVTRHMEPILVAHPELSSSKPLPDEILNRIERANPERDSVVTATEDVGPPHRSEATVEITVNERERLKLMVEYHQFSKTYYSVLRDAAHGNPVPYTSLILSTVSRFVSDREQWAYACELLMKYARETLNAPEDKRLIEMLRTSVNLRLREPVKKNLRQPTLGEGLGEP